MKPARVLFPVYRLIPRPVRRGRLLRYLAIPLALLAAWLAAAGAGTQGSLEAGGWSMRAGDVSNLLLLLILGWCLAQLALLGLYLWRKRPAGRSAVAAITLLACWLAVAASPRPVALQRTVALGPDGAGVAPIQAEERWRLSSPGEWLGQRGDPLPAPAGRAPLYYLLRIEPSSAPAGGAFMSCPDYQEGRHTVFTVQRSIALERPGLPLGVHWPYPQLAGFCAPGIVLSGQAASADLPEQVRQRLLRLAGPLTTDYSRYELTAAIGRPEMEPPGPNGVTARARYLLFLELGNRAASAPPYGMALSSWRDFFYAANQCDVAYARFLLANGVQYPDAALAYLARELQDVYLREATARRPAAFPYGLAQDRPRTACGEVLHALADQSSGATLADPVVQAALASAQGGAAAP